VETIRFHLDENVSPKIARALRGEGIDVTTTQESNLLAAKDETQYDFAQQHGRVLITQDTDFLRIASETYDHFGIVFSTMERHPHGKIILACTALYYSFTAEEMRGRVEYI
jgi:predicted nuclease of predicted toxin-antitoxin system